MSDPFRPTIEALCAADLLKRVEALEKLLATKPAKPPAEVHDGKRKPADKP